MRSNSLIFNIILFVAISNYCPAQNTKRMQKVNDSEIYYTMPDEISAHKGTWLQWPHHY